ncbi:hypothetical protein OQA88_13403 [Cercophora sp. LCS_1]
MSEDVVDDPSVPPPTDSTPLLGVRPKQPRHKNLRKLVKRNLRRIVLLSSLLATLVFLLWLIPRLVKPTEPDEYERQRDKQWVDSSPYWIDRQLCRWLSLCGIMHIRWDAPALGDDAGDLAVEMLKLLALGLSAQRGMTYKDGEEEAWETAPMDHEGGRIKGLGTGSGKILEDVPDFVLQHAPLVHLYSEENFWPSDMREHLRHLSAFEGGGEINMSAPLSLEHLGELNRHKGIVFLESEDDVERRPEWLHSRVGIPQAFGKDELEDVEPPADEKEPSRGGRTWWDADKKHPPQMITDPGERRGKDRRPHQKRSAESRLPIEDYERASEDGKPTPGGYSTGPAVLILVDKGSGILDAFWFFFYSYNLGQTVLNIRFGNHVGDWEHCMIRYDHGVPRAMFLSEHAGGKAYAWKAMEKKRVNGSEFERPVIYSAVGSHAMYALPGWHPYVLPFKMLKDITDEGPLWDPAQNHLAYWYDYEAGNEEVAGPQDREPTSLEPAASNPGAPVSWFHYKGFWGDDIYPLSDRRQWRLFGEYHYIVGPLGPKFKFLERRKVCQTEKCTIVDSIAAGEKSAWY